MPYRYPSEFRRKVLDLSPGRCTGTPTTKVDSHMGSDPALCHKGHFTGTMASMATMVIAVSGMPSLR